VNLKGQQRFVTSYFQTRPLLMLKSVILKKGRGSLSLNQKLGGEGGKTHEIHLVSSRRLHRFPSPPHAHWRWWWPQTPFGFTLFLFMNSRSWEGISARTSSAKFSGVLPGFLKGTNWTMSLLACWAPLRRTPSSPSSITMSLKSWEPTPTMTIESGKAVAVTMASMVSDKSVIAPSVRIKRIKYFMSAGGEAFAIEVALLFTR